MSNQAITDRSMLEQPQTRRRMVGALAFVVGLAAGSIPYNSVFADDSDDEALKRRFDYLSMNGNSNCSRAFLESIASMPPTTRLQGSCCSQMDEHRYVEQVKGLRKFSNVSMIPADPYDVPAGLAQRLIPLYELELEAKEQVAYDYAMANSTEQGPCCCQCWRWHVYGGLAKYLIREHSFTGEQIAQVWDLSDGCGGSGDHIH